MRTTQHPRRRARREAAAARLVAAVKNKAHDWKASDGAAKAKECLARLTAKGIVVGD